MKRLLGIVAIVFCGAGCTTGPRYPLLCENFETVIVGEVVAVSEPQPNRFLHDTMIFPDSVDPDSIYFKYRKTEISVSHVDICNSAVGVVVGDTIPVMCLASNTSEPIQGVGEPLVMVISRKTDPEWGVGQSGIFLLGAIDNKWVPLGFEDEEEYRKADFTRKETESYENLTPEFKFE